MLQVHQSSTITFVTRRMSFSKMHVNEKDFTSRKEYCSFVLFEYSINWNLFDLFIGKKLSIDVTSEKRIRY